MSIRARINKRMEAETAAMEPYTLTTIPPGNRPSTSRPSGLPKMEAWKRTDWAAHINKLQFDPHAPEEE